MKDYLIIALQVLSLFTIVFSALKVINRNIDEWKAREMRLAHIESELSDMRQVSRDIAGLNVRLSDIASEIERMRSRLDRFLDTNGSRSDRGC